MAKKLEGLLVGFGFIPPHHEQAAHGVLGRTQIEFTSCVPAGPDEPFEPARDRAINAGIDESRIYRSVEDALAGEKNVALALVATPNCDHLAGVEALASAGKAIVCEKPIAGELEGARAIRNLIKKTGLPSMVPFTYTGHSAALEMAYQIQERGLADQFLSADAFYRQAWLWDPEAGAWRRNPAISGEGGATGDILTHIIALVLKALGNPGVKGVLGHRRTVILDPKKHTDDEVTSIIQLESGAEIRATALQYAGGFDNDIEIVLYFKGGVSMGWSMREQSEILWITEEGNGPRQQWTRAHFESPLHAATFTTPSMHIDGYTSALGRLYQSLIWQIEGSGPCDPFHPDIEFGYQISRVIDGIIWSSKQPIPWMELQK